MSNGRSDAWRLTVPALAAFLALPCAGCAFDDSPTGAKQTIPDAGPPALCTAAAASTPFCTSVAGTCPLLADDVITCPGNGVVTTGLATSEEVGFTSAANHGGDLVFATLGGYAGDQKEYVELASFGPTGAASFTLETLAPLAYPSSADTTQAGLVVVSGAKGAPVILSTLDGALRAAVGSAPSGGAFKTELALAAPVSSYSAGWYIVGAGVEPDGSVDVLLQGGGKDVVAHRDAAGGWTNHAIATALTQAAIAIGTAGTLYIAGWTTSSTTGMEDLQLVVGSSPAVRLATVTQANVTQLSVSVGQSGGASLPVVAFGSPVTLAVPDGNGGFTTIQPTLAVTTPYVDGCSSSLSLGNCSCPTSCSQTGDGISWLQLVRDAQGDVYVAWLEVDANRVYPVMLNSTSIGSQMITCSCDPQQDSVDDKSVAIGLQLDRVVLSPMPHTEHRGTIPVPQQTVSLQATDGNGTLQLLVSGTAAGNATTLRRVVLDASQLP